MKAFIEPMLQMMEYERLMEHLKKQRGLVEVSGCMDAVKPHLMYAAGHGVFGKLLITYSELRAKELLEEYRFFDREAVYYPARDILFYQSDIRGNLLTGQRMGAIAAMLTQERPTVIATFDALMDRLAPPESIVGNVLRYRVGDVVDVGETSRRLAQLGYERCGQAEMAGQFAIRGGILDIFPLTSEVPYRMELWGDEVDSLRSFDPESQRSIENLEEIAIYQASEIILNEDIIKCGLNKIEKEFRETYNALREQMRTEEAHRLKQTVGQVMEELDCLAGGVNVESYLSYFYPESVSLLSYFDWDRTLLFLDEPERCMEMGRAVQAEFSESMQRRLEKGYVLPGQADAIYSCERTMAALQGCRGAALTTLDLAARDIGERQRLSISAKTVSPYNSSFELLLKDLRQYKRNGYRVIVLSGSHARAKRLSEDLQQEDLSCFYTENYDHPVQPGEIMVAYGKLKHGFEYPQIGFVVISESDIFGEEKKKRKKRRIYQGEKIADFAQLSIGDYVVHESHGLGIYRGIEKVDVEGVVKDYIKIEYDKGGNLYIQATQLELIQKYAGSDAGKLKLNRLGGQEWGKARKRVQGAVREIARELVELYADRQNREGFVYGPDTVWQREFEEMFPFEETEDQTLAIEAVKADMESNRIMDRLICGDVGYGKTEIAIRASFKAVQEGKQVVYLAPTTILAQQHYNTFAQRMKDFPVRVDLLCRFCTPAQMKQTVADLKKGQVDILIGTHRALSKDVEFKDLGLLVIDEEQRFGVTHKEKIKQMKRNVDVLALTATPIPRTLHMSLIGIRDMSVLEEPPMDRLPIQTYVMEYDEEIVREAVRREMARGGQVYYVFNRVHQIADVAAKVAALVPEANVAFAHGQMKERELERIMGDFINGEIDVLASTTIIETGLDISNVNTIIIQDADRLGLSQLYQLRGRVGRSNRMAYAFLMYRRDKLLKEVAEKRLSAIREFTELGSGFKVAMRDLEIRGAGNLLGAQQHGHMEAVGYDLYCKMLSQAVKEIQGVEQPERFETAIDIDVDAYIPPTYIPNEGQKLDIYKRIAGIESQEECEEMQDELMDRFGEPPKSVQNLLLVAGMKARAHRLYFTEIRQRGEELKFTLYEKARIDVAGIPGFVEEFYGALQFTPDAAGPYFTFRMSHNSRARGQAQEAAVAVLERAERHLSRKERN